MRKILFVDTETTGLDPKINGIHQIAMQIVVGGELKEEIDLKFRPLPTEKVEKEALAVSNLTVDLLAERTMTSRQAYDSFNKTLCKYVNKYDKHDKFVVAGYNCGFDAGFLNEWYVKHDNKYFFGLCHGGAYLDGLSMALMVEVKKGEKIFQPNRKLATVAKHLGVDLENAHDALADITATRDVIKILWGMLTK